MNKFLLVTILVLISKTVLASPIISGISTSEIEIDTKFQGAKILLFGAKGDAGNIIVAVRGPKKNFLVTKKKRLLGLWHNGQRVEFKDSHNFYSLFSTLNNHRPLNGLLKELELGKNHLEFKTENAVSTRIQSEFKMQLIEKLEKDDLYAENANEVIFLNETLFKVILDFPKNISRGVYAVEIYLINDDTLISFQTIPIYVNQAGFSATVLDFAYKKSIIYGLFSIALALIIGWVANFVFSRLSGKS